MPTSWLKIVSAAFIVMVLASAATASANDPCALPEDLGQQLAIQYPGMSVATLSRLDQDDKSFFLKDHPGACPGIADATDFYGDGKPTVAILLVAEVNGKYTDRSIVAHKTSRAWTLRLVESNAGWAAVWSSEPGVYQDISSGEKINSKHTAIIFCRYEAVAILYYWTGKGVKKIWLVD